MSDDTRIAELCRRVADVRGDVAELLAAEVRRVAPLATPDEQRHLTSEALARLRGLGILEPLLADPGVDEVLVNGADVWVERAGALEPAGTLVGHSVGELVERILAPLGRRVDRTSPIVDARLADGSRVSAVVEPVAVDGPHLSIRKFGGTVRSLGEFTDPAGVDVCRQLVHERCNVIVSGATSSGKTSLLAALLAEVDHHERLVVLEDTAELAVGGRHAVRLEARPPSPDGPPGISLADLVRAALRLRPDRLVVGEVRGDEVLGMVQALNTGHDGSVATCHANGPLDAIARLESLVLQAAPTWPMAAIREQLRRSLDVVVHVTRDRDGRRTVSSVHEMMRDRSGAAGPTTESLRPIAVRTDDGHVRRTAELTVGRR